MTSAGILYLSGMKIIARTFTCLFLLLTVGTTTFNLTGCKGRRASQNTTERPRDNFSKGNLNFSFQPTPDLMRIGPDSVGWAAYLPQTEESGPLVYYFFPGARVNLSDPQIRVEYISSSMEGAESVDKLFSWLKDLFINPEKNGKLITDSETLTTGDGLKVRLLEIHTPDRMDNSGEEPHKISGKRMAWVYIPQEEYYVAMNASAAMEQDYEQLRPLFIQLVKSFRQESFRQEK